MQSTIPILHISFCKVNMVVCRDASPINYNSWISLKLDTIGAKMFVFKRYFGTATLIIYHILTYIYQSVTRTTIRITELSDLDHVRLTEIPIDVHYVRDINHYMQHNMSCPVWIQSFIFYWIDEEFGICSVKSIKDLGSDFNNDKIMQSQI